MNDRIIPSNLKIPVDELNKHFYKAEQENKNSYIFDSGGKKYLIVKQDNDFVLSEITEIIYPIKGEDVIVK